MSVNISEVQNAFNSKRSVEIIFNKISAGIERPLIDSERNYVASLVKAQGVSFFQAHSSIADCQSAIIDYVLKKLVVRGPPAPASKPEWEDNVPIEDQLRDEIKHEGVRQRQDVELGDYTVAAPAPPLAVRCADLLGAKSVPDLIDVINPRAAQKTYPPLLLDTRNRILVDRDPGVRNQISWNFYVGTRFEQGAVNGPFAPHNITGIECGTIYLPDITNTASTEYRMISMFIQEFSEQSSILSSSTRYHFLFNVDIISESSGSRRLKLTPIFADVAETRFVTELTGLSTFTVSFGNPAEPIVFDNDRDLSPQSVTSGTAPEEGTVFRTSVVHGMQNGELVYLEGFTTGNPIADYAVIQQANSQQGLTIQEADIDPYAFTVSTLDTSTCTGPITVSRIIFGSRRFYIPLKIKYRN